MAERRGFTLIEALIALSIIGMIAGLGLFAGMDAYRTSLIGSEADVIATALIRARSNAMADGTVHRLCLDPATDSYVLYTSGVRFPHAGSVSVAGMPSCEEGGIAFAGYSGASAGARISVSQGGIERMITVNGAGFIDTGR